MNPRLEVTGQFRDFIKAAKENTFTTSPILPACYTYAVERGDPNTGPSVTLSRLAAGCKVPFIRRGTFQLTMKGQEAQMLSQGAYAYVLAKHQHEESCLDGCTYTTLSARVRLMFTMLMHAGKRFHHKSRLQRLGSTQPPLYPPSNSSGPTCDHEFRRDPRFDECNDDVSTNDADNTQA